MNVKTLIQDFVTFVSTKLNENSYGVTFNLGYLFERDVHGNYNLTENEETLNYDEEIFIPAMLQFKSNANKPLNFDLTNQLAKSGSALIYFSLPDKDDVTAETRNLYNNALLAIEEFENKYTGKRGLSLTSNSKNYGVLLNTMPITVSSTVKFDAEWRTLVTMTIPTKLGYNIAYAEDTKTEIKRYLDDDSKYVEIELSEVKSGQTSATEMFQDESDKFAHVGIQNTAATKQFKIYYPKGNAYKDKPDTKAMLLEFFRREADKDYKADKRYTIRTTYPDFASPKDYKVISEIPNRVKGMELTMTVSLAPYKE